MALPPLLVPASDEEHGCAVGGGAADDAEADADGGGFDGGGVVDADADGGAVAGHGVWILGGFADGVGDAAVHLVVGVDGEGGVDHGDDGRDGGVGVVVEFFGLGVED